MTQIEKLARERRTVKLLPDPANPLPTGGLARSEVEALIACAGWAPFHRPNAEAREGSATAREPWRFHLLDGAGCRALIAPLETLPKPPKKLSNMLAAADALILATWLPEPFEGEGWEPSLYNMEHIAAASAAVQTLLLAATERGLTNYWSSGGSLATLDAFKLLRIPDGEILLGAIFLFPEAPEDIERGEGKMRPLRAEPSAWSRWIDIAGDAGP